MTDPLATTRTLHRVAVHVVARARVQSDGRFSLRITPGGLGTPDLHGGTRRVRISGSRLLVESDVKGAASIRACGIDGATLRELGAVAGVDLQAPLDVGEDTPALGDLDAPLTLDGQEAAGIAAWYATAATALDHVVESLAASAAPTLPRLWPEHFDVAVEAQASPDRRVNLGASPGDGYCAEPYVYVGPWTSDRPGADGFWNAPFGALRTASALGEDRIGAAVAFFLEGCRRLA